MKNQKNLPSKVIQSVFVIAVFLLLCSGCSAGRTRGFESSTYEIVKEDSTQRSGNAMLEYSDYDNELAAELAAAPLEFEIQYPEASYAFERARIFFQRFGGGESLTMRGAKEVSLTARKTTPRDISYALVRRESPGGARFVVVCRDAAGGGLASTEDYRCRNFARFVKLGKIEDRLVTEQLAVAR